MSSPYQDLYQPYANKIATAAGVPANIFSALIAQESSWNPFAMSTTSQGQHAFGLTQLMPATAAQVGADGYISDPISNMQGGATYLSSLYSKYGNWTDALAAYNAGTPSSTAGQAYAASVLQKAGVSASAPAKTPLQSTWDKINGWLTALPAVNAVEYAVNPSGQAARTQNEINTIGGAFGAPTDKTGNVTGYSLGQRVLVYGIAGAGLLFVTYFGIKALFDLRGEK